MSTLSADVKPPSNVGMTILDRSKFDVELPLVAAEIMNPRMLARLVKECPASDLLRLPRLPTIITLSKSQRAVILNHEITDPETAFDKLSDKTKQLLNEAGFNMGHHTLTLGYDFWTSEEILHSILPADLGDLPSGFAQVGHIAHMNLRDPFLPYKQLIGQVILDKNSPSVRTVVHKLDSIGTVYRTFDMEVMAGVPEFTVEQLESNCRFQFDFRKVYWNSRLHTEHDRLVQLFGEGNAICDPMAGVGPFAIPAAKKGNIVFANDLNPESYKAMENNLKLNRVNPEVLRLYNEDGRVFINRSVKLLHELRDVHKGEKLPVMMPKSLRKADTSKAEDGSKEDSSKSAEASPRKKVKHQPKTVAVPEFFSHYVMNLPASAIEFLDGFRGLYRGLEFSTENPPLPMIHVHCFFKFDPHEEEPGPEEVQRSISDRISKAMRYEITPDNISLHNVRRVAPTKDMYAVSFELPREVAYADN